jgi:nucleotide-binding universal stress UspA family protein
VNARLNPDFSIEPDAVVVGVDGTETAVRAAIWAAAEARLRNTALHILHAAPYATGPTGRRHASGILGRARTAARQGAPGLDVHIVTSLLSPVGALVAAGEQAELLVLGLITGGSPAEPVFGSVTPAVSFHARCPVVVVHGSHPTGGGSAPVVVGVHTADVDAAALDAAFADAARHGTALVAVHGGSGDATLEQLADALTPWRDRFPEVPVECMVTRGHPRDALLDAARTARLVVLGGHRRSAPARVLFGSVSRDLLRLSPVPVEIVRRGSPDPHAAVAVAVARHSEGG